MAFHATNVERSLKPPPLWRFTKFRNIARMRVEKK